MINTGVQSQKPTDGGNRDFGARLATTTRTKALKSDSDTADLVRVGIKDLERLSSSDATVNDNTPTPVSGLD